MGKIKLPLVSHQRPENMTQLVEAYLQVSGVASRGSLPVEFLRVPYPPTHNTMFILKRFQSHDDFMDEITIVEHARSAFNSWMPGSYIVPETYWKSEPSAMIAMEHILGKNGSEVNMGGWTREQRMSFVRQMAVIGICLNWGPQNAGSGNIAKALASRVPKYGSAAAYDEKGIGDLHTNALPGGLVLPRPLLGDFRFVRPCDISLRGSTIVAITGWGSIIAWWRGKGGRASDGGLPVLSDLDDTPPPKDNALGPNWAIIRAYGGRIREDDFMEAVFDSESDWDGGREEAEKLSEDWYHEPAWQLLSECVCRCGVRAEPLPIREYVKWA